jgi:DNA-binding NarL/FixJ family response regulator
MKETVKLIIANADASLLADWHGALGKVSTVAVTDFEDLQHLPLKFSSIVLLDLALPGVPKFSQPVLVNFPNAYKHRLVATNSFNKDKEAIQALDEVCGGYCHAFSDANTLHQTRQVVGVGQVWISKTLMQRLT